MKQPHLNQPSWRVLLIGGSSGVGKTSVAHALASRLGLSVLLVDDIRMAIQQVTMPGEQPGIHYFLAHPTIWQKPPEVARDGFIRVGEALMRPLAAAIAHHVFVAGSGPVIIEGDGILPALAAQRIFPSLHFASVQLNSEVRSVFLVEPDEDVLAHNISQREHGFRDMSIREQQTLVRSSWLYGQWLKRQAESYDLPVIEPRSTRNLLDRILQAV